MAGDNGNNDHAGAAPAEQLASHTARHAEAPASERTPDDGLIGLPEAWQRLRYWTLRLFVRPRWRRPAGGSSSRGLPLDVGRTLSVAAVLFAGTFLADRFFNLVDPLGLSRVTQAQSEQVTARLLAPFYGGDAPHRGQGRIAVVLINEASMAARGQAWPLQYADMADVLKRVIRQAPAAIYLDIYIDGGRAYDGSLTDAREYIGDLLDEARIPLLQAVPQVGAPTWLAGVSPWAQPVVSSWHGYGTAYPLTVARAQTGIAGQANMAHAPDVLSPAMTLFNTLCPAGAQCRKDMPARPTALEPLVIQWGSRFPQHSPARDCQGEPSPPWLEALALAWQDVSSGIDDSATQRERVRCPYALTLFEDQLDDPAQAELLKGRAVVVGAALKSMPDWVQSPVHQKIPGAYLHAMALDNLLTWGTDYIKSTRLPQLLAPLALVMALSLLLSISLRHWHGWRVMFITALAGIVLIVAVNVSMHWIFRQPPPDWVGAGALFIAVLGVLKSQNARPPLAPITTAPDSAQGDPHAS